MMVELAKNLALIKICQTLMYQQKEFSDITPNVALARPLIKFF